MEALSTQARKWQEYFIYFLFYSIIGWCYEIFLDVVIYQTGFVNRGFLFGPYCPVYGVGTLIFLFCLGSLQKKKILLGKLNITPILVFLGIIAITTGIELLASYLLDMTGGGQLWDYSEYAWNFQGRIAPNTSIRFGLGGMLFLYILQPILVKSVHSWSRKKLNLLFFSLFSIFTVDFIIKCLF